ncbi:Mce protein [Mycolicibacterium sp. jd]|uniref:Mce protein n=1 Tax=unclassified Mycolicibacterium TaxID=2636767 RepID=UPI00351AF51F
MAGHAYAASRSLSGSGSSKDSTTAEDWPDTEDDAQPNGDTAESVDERTESPSGESDSPRRLGCSPKLLVMALGVVIVVLGCLVGWLGYRTHEIQKVQAEQDMFVEAARQGAVNLTTFGFDTTDADIQRILDSTTGSFHNDFQTGAEPFVAVIKQAQSRSEGSVTEAGLESQEGDRAQVLLAVSVKTSNAGAPEQEPRSWRMRIGVQKVGDGAKVSSVTFVP